MSAACYGFNEGNGMPLYDFIIGFVIGAFVALAVLAVATNIGSDKEEDCGKDEQEGDEEEW